MKIELYQAIQLLVELQLPRFSPPTKVMHINVEATYTIKRRKRYRDIHLLFHRPNNYTKVFWYVSKKPIRVHDIPDNKWELKCDHDSCWTSDGLSSPLFEIEQELRASDYENECNEFVRFGLIPINWLEMNVERLQGDMGNCYPPKYKLTTL